MLPEVFCHKSFPRIYFSLRQSFEPPRVLPFHPQDDLKKRSHIGKPYIFFQYFFVSGESVIELQFSMPCLRLPGQARRAEYSRFSSTSADMASILPFIILQSARNYTRRRYGIGNQAMGHDLTSFHAGGFCRPLRGTDRSDTHLATREERIARHRNAANWIISLILYSVVCILLAFVVIGVPLE